jgi:hypothetical protein
VRFGNIFFLGPIMIFCLPKLIIDHIILGFEKLSTG